MAKLFPAGKPEMRSLVMGFFMILPSNDFARFRNCKIMAGKIIKTGFSNSLKRGAADCVSNRDTNNPRSTASRSLSAERRKCAASVKTASQVNSG
jgi:hypothetical protein